MCESPIAKATAVGSAESHVAAPALSIAAIPSGPYTRYCASTGKANEGAGSVVVGATVVDGGRIVVVVVGARVVVAGAAVDVVVGVVGGSGVDVAVSADEPHAAVNSVATATVAIVPFT